jgi:hypothetical protein
VSSLQKNILEIEPGDVIPVRELIVTQEFNDQIAFALEDYQSLYFKTGTNNPIVHPAILMAFTSSAMGAEIVSVVEGKELRIRSHGYIYPDGVGGIHTRDEPRFLGIARVGTRLVGTETVVDVVPDKRGIKHVVTSQIHDDEGHLVFGKRLTRLIVQEGTRL